MSTDKDNDFIRKCTEFIIDKVDEKLLCNNCKKVLIRPLKCCCGSLYCAKCMLNYNNNKNNKNTKCKNCTDDNLMISVNIREDEKISKEIAKLKCKCPTINCYYKDTLQNFIKHYQDCQVIQQEPELDEAIIIINLKYQIEDLTRKLKVCPYTWTITDFRHKQNEAKMNKNKLLHSEEFYSRTNEYIINILLYPNGTMNGLNSHLSVFIQLFRNDDNKGLEWPPPSNEKFILSIMIDVDGKIEKLRSLTLPGFYFRYGYSKINNQIGFKKFIPFGELKSSNIIHLKLERI